MGYWNNKRKVACNKKITLKLLLVSLMCIVCIISLCACSGGGKSHNDMSLGSNKKSESIESSGTSESATETRHVEVFTGTLPDVDNMDLSEAGALDGDDSTLKGPKDRNGYSENREETDDALDASESTISEPEIERVNRDTDDMIEVSAHYGDVLLVHEDGEIRNITRDVSGDRYHDGDEGYYYHSLAGMDALIPGYYNYYQTDGLGFDHFYVFSDSAYPQISFMSYDEGDGEPLTDDNYQKYQDEILDAWEQETEDIYKEQSRVSFTIGDYKLRESVIRGRRDGRPITACLELLWDADRKTILAISFFMCDTDGQSYMDDFVTMMTDHISKSD